MKWYVYLICAVLIIVGILCSFGLVSLFDKQSLEYGQALLLNKQENYTEISKFDNSLLYDFYSEDNLNYKSKATFNNQKFDGTDKDYVITVNGQLTNDIEVSSGKISGKLVLVFYNTDGAKISTANVQILIEYLSQETRVSLAVKNEQDSVAYLNTYIDINGFVICVNERSN